MIKDNINEIKEIKRIIDSKLDKDDIYNTFWCPKNTFNEKDYDGFRLYAYGGRLLDIYEENQFLKLKFLDDTYINYFKEGYFDSKDSFQRFVEEHGSVDGIKSIGLEDWAEIMYAYKNRAENFSVKSNDHHHYERERENKIATITNNSLKSDYEVIDMESSISLGNGRFAKPDLVVLRIKNSIPYIYFVEYKCTNGGIDGTDLVEHFRDMKEYYNSNVVIENIKKLYNRKKEFEGRYLENEKDLRWKYTKSSIVFLFSDITNDSKSKETISVKKILNHFYKLFYEMGNCRGKNRTYIDEEKCTCFWILDKSFDLAEMRIISYQDMIKTCDKALMDKIQGL